jgi:hypothetical protein
MRTLVALSILSFALTAHATPLEIEGRSTDRGIKMTLGRNDVTLVGVAHGPTTPRDEFGIPRLYSLAHSVSFTLDIDKAPTVDLLGRTNYTEKNRRIFSVDTTHGWDAQEIATRLSAKVNAHPSFSAQVKLHRNGSATLRLGRR